eukprot:jgi/Mesen1/2820/ME000172S01966
MAATEGVGQLTWPRRTASAPGKVILFGEHAVVHGMTSVAASIDLRTTATVDLGPVLAPGHGPGPYINTLGASLCYSKWALSEIAAAFHDNDDAPSPFNDTRIFRPHPGPGSGPGVEVSKPKPQNPAGENPAGLQGTTAAAQELEFESSQRETSLAGNAEGRGGSPHEVASCGAPLLGRLRALAERQLAGGGKASMAAGVAAFLFLQRQILGVVVLARAEMPPVASLTLHLAPCRSRSCTVSIETELPIGAGLGSSAAFCVALSAALLATAGALPAPPHGSALPRAGGSGQARAWVQGQSQNDAPGVVTASPPLPCVAAVLPACKEQANGVNDAHLAAQKGPRRAPPGAPGGGWLELGEAGSEIVNAWAFAGEAIIHGRPSGVDNNGKISRIANPPHLRVLLTDTRVARNTSTLVGGVGERFARLPDAVGQIFRAIDSIAAAAIVLLRQHPEAPPSAASCPPQNAPATCHVACAGGTEAGGIKAGHAEAGNAEVGDCGGNGPSRNTRKANPHNDDEEEGKGGEEEKTSSLPEAPGGRQSQPRPGEDDDARSAQPARARGACRPSHPADGRGTGDGSIPKSAGFFGDGEQFASHALSRNDDDDVEGCTPADKKHEEECGCLGEPGGASEGSETRAGGASGGGEGGGGGAGRRGGGGRGGGGGGASEGSGELGERGEGKEDAAAGESARWHAELEELVQMNQGLLAALGVSHLAIDSVCAGSAAFGLSSKLTGAGGGGCVLTLLPPGVPHETVEAAKSALRQRGFDCFEAAVGPRP